VVDDGQVVRDWEWNPAESFRCQIRSNGLSSLPYVIDFEIDEIETDYS